MQRKVGIIEEAIASIPPISRMKLIRDAGFDSYSTNTYKAKDLEPSANAAKAVGLVPDFLHAPFDNINSIWYKTSEHPEIFFKMCEAIDTAAAFEIPTVVIHSASGWNPPEISERGLYRYDVLVERAAKLGVKIAFENLRTVPHSVYLSFRYRAFDNVGFCYDSGHESCFTETVEWLGLLGKNTLCTHLHDNFGKRNDPDVNDDLHLLPFDGNIDFRGVKERLDRYNYTGNLTLEVFDTCSPNYKDMGEEAFIKLAYERVSKINSL